MKASTRDLARVVGAGIQYNVNAHTAVCAAATIGHQQVLDAIVIHIGMDGSAMLGFSKKTIRRYAGSRRL